MKANNMAAMRKALTKVSEWMAHRIATGGFEASPTIPTVLEDVVLPALSAPPRECDMFADEKQADALHAAFIKYCNGCDCPMGCDHRKNPRFLLDGNCASILKCFARFALSRKVGKK